MRRLFYILGGILMVGVITVVVAYFIADALFNRDRGDPKVLAAPPHSLERQSLAPYRGPHPRTVARPQETFPFPIEPGKTGPSEPLFAGPSRYPFLCRTVESGLGQPLVDNQQGHGMAVFEETQAGDVTGTIVGYSKDCQLATRIAYYYLSKDSGEFEPWHADIDDAAIVTLAGKPQPLVVRVETGTINRHIYFIAMPVANPSAATPDLSLWNRRLVYMFRGGVGIGYRQGRVHPESLLRRRQDQLSKGYAVAYSSANQSSNTYNSWLNEDTALRVKRQFVATYGEPEYTVGVGGSGGAIQQYLLAQNSPGLLDAALALYSFPDMVTQSIYVLDCELLEYYFDVTAPQPERWRNALTRTPIEGLNASAELLPELAWMYRLRALAKGRWPQLGGATECARAWRGATPLVINPTYAHFMTRFEASLAARVEWTYFADLREFFGTDEQGYARRTWDNVGVQYGLSALIAGQIDLAEFLNLNWHIGGWKPPYQMQAPRFWLMDTAPSSLAEFSPWGHHNMQLADHRPAQRSEGDLEAIAAAYRSGQVFLGLIDIPVIDLRHYLEPELDMHHALASLSARQRIARAMGNADHQLIWMTRQPHEPYNEAFELIDRWMQNIRTNPQRSLAANKPSDAQDRCYDAEGRLLASGQGVWDGAWNNKQPGACMRVYPNYTTSRMVAGDGPAGDVFKCALQSVDLAIARGVYGSIDVSIQRARLQEIFPEGVCDYTRIDQGLPRELAELAGYAPAEP